MKTRWRKSRPRTTCTCRWASGYPSASSHELQRQIQLDARHVSNRDRRQRLVLVGHMQRSQETGAPKRGRYRGASVGSRIAVFAQMGEHYDGKARVMQLAQELGGSPIGEM